MIGQIEINELKDLLDESEDREIKIERRFLEDFILLFYEARTYNLVGTAEQCIDNKNFLEFLCNTINPNDMEKYLSMYHAAEEKANGMVEK